MTGSVDGKHHFFKCSRCFAPLADIWVNYPDDDISWNFVAECCHCGDKSYQQTVKGSFSIGRTPESEQYTAIEDIDMDTDPIVIKTKKVKNYVV